MLALAIVINVGPRMISSAGGVRLVAACAVLLVANLGLYIIDHEKNPYDQAGPWREFAELADEIGQETAIRPVGVLTRNPEAFQLISGELLNQMLGESDNRLGRLLKEGKSNRAILEEFYLAALSRLPAPAEARELLAQVEARADRRAAWEDVVWGLLNSKSFLLRQ